MSNQIIGKAAVVVSPHSYFDLSDPQASPVHAFSHINPAYAPDGVLCESWARDGYRLVGYAEITITLLPQDTMISSAVESLKAMKQKVIAGAELESNRIEGEIQKLLAISYEGASS